VIDVRFAPMLSWWTAAAIAVAVVVVVAFAYRRPLVPLSRTKVSTLVVLRAAALLALFVFVMRPVARVAPSSTDQAVVPILIDVSRSMRTADADGLSRLARARAIAQFDLLPALLDYSRRNTTLSHHSRQVVQLRGESAHPTHEPRPVCGSRLPATPQMKIKFHN